MNINRALEIVDELSVNEDALNDEETRELTFTLAFVITALEEKHGFREDKPGTILIDATLGALEFARKSLLEI